MYLEVIIIINNKKKQVLFDLPIGVIVVVSTVVVVRVRPVVITKNHFSDVKFSGKKQGITWF